MFREKQTNLILQTILFGPLIYRYDKILRQTVRPSEHNAFLASYLTVLSYIFPTKIIQLKDQI